MRTAALLILTASALHAAALARCGRVATAKRVLKRAIRRGATADQMALFRWLDAGAPSVWPGRARHDVPEPRASGTSVAASGTGEDPPADDRPKKPRRRRAREQSAGD